MSCACSYGIVIIYNVNFNRRGLGLFFKILPISNTGVSAAYIFATVHFLYPKLLPSSLPGLKVPKHFVRLIQMQCSPSFDCN